ncbi:hypothetical protein [Mycobacteroides abscessus]|uniref:hypothetical protein n=1 Tax=Mycobacteroides abscessus TaxID=36809 RepID=UPI000D9BA02D|nr:hypothetical protein [Mycobacteroides abscessus]SPX87818.1 Uncharacterised protein [Mycobacteroides abscessus]
MEQSPDNLTYGFHGTSDLYVASILQEGFRRSTKPWDWLGHAIYFWEGDYERAADWAAMIAGKDGGNPVVARALIDLSHCFDLTLQRYRYQLAQTAVTVIRNLPPEALLKMRQTEYRRDLDCHVLNTLFSAAIRDDGSRLFTTVRGLFREGQPLYVVSGLASGIHDQDHIQIGVLDHEAIRDIDITSGS